MAKKKITKFNIKSLGSPPINPGAYPCFTSGTQGIWLIGDRNNNESNDKEGEGSTNVLLFLPHGNFKVCAPEPPFGTDDLGDE